MPHAPRLTLLLFLALASTAATAQNATRTVAFANSDPAGEPPRSLSWSPDGTRLTFVATDTPILSHVGQPGDIVQIDARTGKASVLATAAQLNALSSGPISEKDQDHRDRYDMASFLWADDSRHLVLDKGGHLWLYSVADGSSTLLVDTGAGSGDDPKFSPDARFVSYLRGHNLYLHPIADKPAADKPAPNADTALTHTKSDSLLNGEVDWVYLEELEVRSNYFWSPDSSAIAYLQADESKVPVYPIADWIPRHTTVDPQPFPQPGDPNPAVRIGVVPVQGKDAGKTRFIDLPFSAGNDYIPRFGWIDPSTLFIEVLTRDQKHLNLYFADTRTGASRLVYTDTDPKYLDENYEITFLGNGRFLAPSWRDGHTHLYLYHFDPQHLLASDATLVRQLTRGDFEVESVAGFDPKSETVFYTSTEGSPLENNLWSIRLDGSNRQRLTTAPGVHDVQLSPDNSHFADIASTSTAPPVASLCTLHKGCTPFWSSNPVPTAAGVTTTPVTFTAADGKTTLYGTLTLPATTGTASTPLILNPYGGPLPTAGARNAWSGGRLFDEVLAQHGFAVLQVDNRGSGGRGRDFQQAAYQTFGPVQFADQMAALDQTLASHPQLDPKRIGWWGWSWGGSFTLYAMTHTDRIRAGVAVAPVTDWHNYDSIYTERYLGLPSASSSGNPDDNYTTESPVTHAADLKGRLLIAQGTGDDNVHIANTIQFIEPLIKAGIPYDLQLFPRKTHSIAGTEARNELFTRILSQFETYLK
jgi:dipeptidyl-peptidase 4